MSIERKSIRPFSFPPSLLLVIALLFPLTLLGAEQTVPQTPRPLPQAESSVPQASPSDSQAASSVPQTAIVDRFGVIEAPRNYLSEKITGFASYIDRFFGGDRHYQESNQSVVRLNLSRAIGYGGDRKYDLAARLNLKLPATKGRMHLLLETDLENNINAEPTPGSTALSNQVVVPRSIALAARYATPEDHVWHFSTDGGLKFPIPVTPFVRTRASYSVPMGTQWRLKVAESVFWFNTIGVGETTQLDLERFISPQVLFRASSYVTWLNDKQNLDMRQDLSVYHTVDDRTALLYQASVTGVSNPAYAATDYILLMLYRYRLHRNWLFFELSPQLHFPQAMQYHSSPALTMRLEMRFDDSR